MCKHVIWTDKQKKINKQTNSKEGRLQQSVIIIGGSEMTITNYMYLVSFKGSDTTLLSIQDFNHATDMSIWREDTNTKLLAMTNQIGSLLIVHVPKTSLETMPLFQGFAIFSVWQYAYIVWGLEDLLQYTDIKSG